MPASRPPRSKPGTYRPRSTARSNTPRAERGPRAAPAPSRRQQPTAISPLNAAQKRHLRGFAHALKPVILIGQKGVTDAVIAELDNALAHHELVKIKLADDDREARAAALAALAGEVRAEIVQAIGKVACLYRFNPERAQFEALRALGERRRTSR